MTDPADNLKTAWPGLSIKLYVLLGGGRFLVKKAL